MNSFPSNAPRPFRTVDGRPASLRPIAGGLTAILSIAASAAQAGDDLAYSNILVFGDSISDGGAYAAQAPAGAGKFTTNPDPVWVEYVAAGLGLPLAPAAQQGFNYAEGGARVTVTRPGGPGEISRTPVAAQIDRHLARGGRFGVDSLVIIQGGGNDVFATQTNGVDFTPADLKVLDAAAADLAAQLARLQAAGAGTIVTTSVPKFEVFNSRYRAEIAKSAVNVLYVDVATLISEIEANPAFYGISNITDPACRGAAVQSFVCRPDTYVRPDANRTYLFADGVHFTGAVHQMEGELTLAALQAPGQISQLPYVARNEAVALGRSLADHLAAEPARSGWTAFGRAQFGDLTLDGTAQRPQLETEGAHLVIGLDYGLGDRASAGLLLNLGDGEGDFGDTSNGFDMRTIGVGAFARRDFGPISASVQTEYHLTRFKDVTRVVDLGPARRYEQGDTDAETFVLGGELSQALERGAFRVTPSLGLRYEHTRVDGYGEVGNRSSQMSFERQTLETLTAKLGVRGTWELGSWRPFAQAAYEADLLDEERAITVTPSGAPAAFKTTAYRPAASYMVWGLGVEADLTARAAAKVGLEGIAARGDFASTVGYLGLSLRF